MLKWALKSLFTQRSSLVSSILGIAFAFLLAIFFDAIWRGEAEQIVAYPNHIHPDVWVMQNGVHNMHMAVSFVWDWKADAIAKLPGVKKVTPITYMNTVVLAGQQKIFAFIVGLLPDATRARPWKLSAGRQVHQSGEAVIPDTLAKINHLRLGDTIQVASHRFRVVGLSVGTYSSANPVLFVPFADLDDILSSSGTYSYLLVDARKGTDPKVLAKRIREHIPKVNALTHAEFIKNDFAMARQMGVDIIDTMTVICSVLAAMIVAFTAYSMVLRKRREIAIIKALGFGNLPILLGIILQNLLTTVLGLLIAALLSWLVIPSVPELVPQLTVKVSMGEILKLGLVALIITLFGSMIPAYKIVRLEPASAYQL